MPDIHAPKASHSIKDPVALAVMQPDPIGADNDTALVQFQGSVIGEGVQVMGSVEFTQAGSREI